MREKSRKKGKFKSKGASIIKGKQSGLKSMKEFLEDSNRIAPSGRFNTDSKPQNHKNTFAQDRIFSKANNDNPFENLKIENAHAKGSQPEGVARLHVHIRKDLADKVLETVFKRKRDRKIMRKDTTQRVIIEQALEDYFDKDHT